MKRIKYLLFIIFALSGFLLSAQTSLNTINLAHQYNPDAEIDLKYQIQSATDSIVIYVQLTINQSKPQLKDYTFDFFTTNTYFEPLQEIPQDKVDSSFLSHKDQHHNMKFAIPINQMMQLGAIRLQSMFSGFTYFYEFSLNSYPLALWNTDGSIQFNAWVSQKAYHFNTEDKIYGYYYSHTFPPALPPMPVKDDAPGKEMPIDSTFIFNGNIPINFEKTGLFLFQKDSSSRQGFSRRVESKYFPKLAKLEDLVEPLIYITTREENMELQNINGDKKAFDKFWLNLTNSPTRAKAIIKSYFDRVENANRLFTTYKEGWKTDMGMIYIIFGPPDEVSKNNNGETWVYLASPDLPKLKFDFIRTENIFSTSHFALVREKNYASSWYRAIDLCRKGRF